MCLGIPGQIVEISDVAQLRAKVDVEGVRREVSIALIGLDGPEAARVGDWVLVHVGFAMAKIDEEEARETLGALKALGDMYEQELTDYSAEIEGLQDDRSAVTGGPS
jgi:hydrogenase expression/formation protein HypC